jgi:hypothetical protein
MNSWFISTILVSRQLRLARAGGGTAMTETLKSKQ